MDEPERYKFIPTRGVGCGQNFASLEDSLLSLSEKEKIAIECVK